MYAVGFDPGGDKAFGWAIVALLNSRIAVHAAGTCSGARAAVERAAESIPEMPAAIGVDAPLFWVADGDRNADVFVRKAVCAAGGSSGTVSHVNSLRGACLVQGVQAARLAHERWPSAVITEAHPKALLLAFARAREVHAQIESRVRTEHERDAVIAAYSGLALASSEPGWHDLVTLDREPYFPGGRRVTYWFPKVRT